MEKCEHQKVSKQSGKRAYASKYLGNCHPNYVGFNSNLQIKPDDEKCKPIVFVPDVDLLNLQEDSIIDSF